MLFWKWVFKIAVQVIPLLLGIDWGRPKPTDRFLNFKPRPKPYRKRKFFD